MLQNRSRDCIGWENAQLKTESVVLDTCVLVVVTITNGSNSSTIGIFDDISGLELLQNLYLNKHSISTYTKI